MRAYSRPWPALFVIVSAAALLLGGTTVPASTEDSVSRVRARTAIPVRLPPGPEAPVQGGDLHFYADPGDVEVYCLTSTCGYRVICDGDTSNHIVGSGHVGDFDCDDITVTPISGRIAVVHH